jgi:hypothetical protein
VEVSAESLYGAVALAICALRQDDWPTAARPAPVRRRQAVVEHVAAAGRAGVV